MASQFKKKARSHFFHKIYIYCSKFSLILAHRKQKDKTDPGEQVSRQNIPAGIHTERMS